MRKSNTLLRRAIKITIQLTLGTLISAVIFGTFYWFNNRLFLWEAKILWVQESFSEVKFKSGSTEDRARMVVDLIQSNRLIEIESDKISDLLGPETGDYYHSDSNSTYRLTDKGNADWILTFVADGEGKIRRIFIRKSCCSVSKKAMYLGLDLAHPLISAPFKGAVR